jgi:hypothetical protein
MTDTRQASSVTAALFATIAGCAAYAALVHWTAPSLWYLPLSRSWHFGAKPATLAMSWYGRTLWVCLASLLGAAIGKAVPWRGARFTQASSALAYLAVIGAVVACAVANIARVTKPIMPPNGERVSCVGTPQ